MIMTLKIVALVALLTYGGLCAYLTFAQRSLVYFPSRTMDATPADVALKYEEVYFQNAQGTKLHGWWLPHENARFTLFFCHGNGGNISHRLDSFEIFHELGLSVFIFDYSGYGLSKGKPSEEATRSDAQAAWGVLTKKLGVIPKDVIVFGRSLGGGVAAQMTADLKAVGVTPAGLIMESTFTSVVDMGRHIYPWLPVSLCARYRYESDKHLAEIRIPALFIHSREDDIVPWEIGRKLFEGYRGTKHFLEIYGNHNSGFRETGLDYARGLDAYLRDLEAGR